MRLCDCVIRTCQTESVALECGREKLFEVRLPSDGTLRLGAGHTGPPRSIGSDAIRDL